MTSPPRRTCTRPRTRTRTRTRPHPLPFPHPRPHPHSRSRPHLRPRTPNEEFIDAMRLNSTWTDLNGKN